MTSMYRTRQIGGAPPPGWNLPPGWGQPLDDPPLLRAAGSVGRWLWPTLSVTGFLVVTGFVFGHDDPTPWTDAPPTANPATSNTPRSIP